MTTILAIETSTQKASVALVRDEALLCQKESGVNAHSEVLLALVDECLRAGDIALGDLDTIAVGAGPGSFTGLRIGMATVKGLCFASGVSLTPVSSLAALAFDCMGECDQDAIIASVLDARRKEIFLGLFAKDENGLRSLGEELVLPPAALSARLPEMLRNSDIDTVLREIVLCGDGANKYADVLQGIGTHLPKVQQTPRAEAVARLAQRLSPIDVLASAKPTYVRLPEAELKFPDGNTGGTFSAR